ncbi:penicillin-binding protein 1A, partial [Pseudomonas aeruginosa]
MRLLKFLWWTCVTLICGVLLSFSGAYLYLSPSLPSVEALRNVQLQIPLKVYSEDGKLISEFGEMRRTPIRFADIPQDFIHALLSAEDDNFANHYGVDVKSLMRAAAQLLKSGHIQTGGSTITMQVAKNYFLTNERSFSRKINEILLALQIERQLTKDEILELYVNKIYLGNRAYGIEAAAQVYYGKPIKDLSLAEMAMIAGLPKAPSRYNPLVNPTRSTERRNWILERMLKLGFIDQQRYQAAVEEPINASYHVQTPELNAPYIAEMARAEMVGRYGSEAYTEGYKVITTVRSDLQNAASQSVRDGLIDYDQRHGYRGPETRLPGQTRDAWLKHLGQQRSIGGLEPAIVTQVEKSGIMVMTRDGKEEAVTWDSMKWARPFLSNNSMGPMPRQPADVAQAGDQIRVQRQEDGTLRFVQIPAAQSALISLDPKDGAIRSLVGGFSFEQSNYNRAIQAKRQPGSSFKPFIYSAALDNGFTAASLVNDAPIVFVDEYLDKVWRPKNDTNTFLGPIPLREALYKSRNMVSIRVLQGLGIERAISYITKFGFQRDELPRNFSLALGTATVTPMEIAGAWSVFANGGYKVNPYVIERIESRDGQ